MDFLFTVRLGNPKKELQKYSREQCLLFGNYALACACKTAVLKNCLLNPFSDFPNRRKERKSKNRYLSVEIRFQISRSIANPKFKT